jgi:hypothetical protein
VITEFSVSVDYRSNSTQYEASERAFHLEGEHHMNVISRRDVIRGSGLALGVPFTSSLMQSAAFAQTTPVPASGPPFSVDLGNYVIDQMARLHAKTNQGTVTHRDLMEASQSVRLFAHHLEAWGVDRLAKSVAANLSTGFANMSNYGVGDALYDRFSKYDTIASRDSFVRDFTVPSTTELGAVQSSILTNGVSWHFHSVADGLRAAALASRVSHTRRVAVSAAKSQIRHAILEPAVYDTSLHPKFLEVDVLSACKQKAIKATCSLLGSDYWNSVIAGALSGAITAFGVNGACTAVGVSAVVVVVISDGEGLPVAAGVWPLCSIIGGAGALVGVFGVGPAVDKAIKNYQKKYCGS